jgi:two-component system, chemotaxis family, CheB/CheR fusion protein
MNSERYLAPIVGVVSGADDPEAVCELLSALPPEGGAPLIVVQRLDAERESAVVSSLAKVTSRTIGMAAEGMLTEQGHVYLLPARAVLTIKGGRVRVEESPKHSKQQPGDILLASLARDRRESAIAVVLSGGGSDGALGTQAVKRCGGLTFAQYPGSARFPSMPISAIDTGCVDRVLWPHEIARELARRDRTSLTTVNAMTAPMRKLTFG